MGRALSKVTISHELDSWSDAELDLISAKAVAGMLETALHKDGNKADAEVAFAIYNLIESAFACLEAGRIR